MRSIHFFSWLFLATVAVPAFAQGPQWVTYSNGNYINDVAFEGDFVWVGSQAGLTKLNKLTGKKQYYLPSNSGIKGFGVNFIHIDADGTKWLGMTQGGLVRFDGGYDWENYFLTNTGDTLTKVFSMKAHPNGDLWLLGYVQGSCYECMKFLKFDGVSLTVMNPVFDANAPNPDLASVQEFDIAPNGDVWAMTGYDLQRYDGTGVIDAFPFDSLMGQFEFPYKIHAREEDEVYFVTSKPIGYNFWRFDGSEWSLASLGSLQDFDEGIYRFVKDPQGNTWFNAYASYPGDTSFYCKYDGTDWQAWAINELPNVPASNTNGPLLLQVDEAGHWWTAVYVDGNEQGLTLFEFDGNQWKGYDNIIFPVNIPYDIAFDCYGKAWLGGQNLVQFDGINWKKYTAADLGFPNEPAIGVLSVVLDTASCDLWMCTSGDLNTSSYLINYHEGVFTIHDLPTGIYASKLVMGKNGEIWMTHSTGVGRFNGTDWTWFDSSNSPLPNFALSLHVDSQGKIWMGTWDALFVYDGNNWVTYSQGNSSITDLINWAYVDRQDVVWVQGFDAFHRFDGNNWEVYPLPESYQYLYGMTQDLNGTYWVYTQNGVYWGNDFNSLQKFNVFNSHIGSSATFGIKVDAYNNKWMMHTEGISVYNGSGVPGRIFSPPNSVQGSVFFDADQDGIFDAANDHGLSGRKVTLLPENTSTFTGAGGYFKLYPTLGGHQITLTVDTPYVHTSPATLDLQMGNSDQTGFDFGIWAHFPLDSVKLELTTSQSRCLGITSVWIHLRDYEEYGGKLTLYHDPLVSFISAEPAPTVVGENALEWDFSDINPEIYEYLKIEFQNPGVEAVGEWLDFTATASVLVYNYTVSDVAASEVRCSYDPNDKKAAPTGNFVAEYSLLGDALDYTIRFQNMGNDTAFAIVVRDTLDASLDANSFELLASSHNVRVVLEAGGILTFFFDNINLLWESLDEPASHGFVKYRINPKPSLPDPTIIHNTAHIYFDFNPAIVTNTTENILVKTLPFLHAQGPTKLAAGLYIYPNPSTGHVWLEMSGAGEWSATIQDAFGRKFRQIRSQGSKLAVESLPTGFYWVTAVQAGRQFSGKLVVVGQ